MNTRTPREIDLTLHYAISEKVGFCQFNAAVEGIDQRDVDSLIVCGLAAVVTEIFDGHKSLIVCRLFAL